MRNLSAPSSTKYSSSPAYRVPSLSLGPLAAPASVMVAYTGGSPCAASVVRSRSNG